jgi:uncharacterized protein
MSSIIPELKMIGETVSPVRESPENLPIKPDLIIILQALKTQVNSTFSPDSPTHGSDHLRRVANLSARIAIKEGADPFVTAAAAWLHDLHRDINASPTAQPDATDHRAIELMRRAKVPPEYYQSILESVHHTDSFSFSDRPLKNASLEAQCLRDADNLDAIGAIGIARTFTYGGSHDIPLWEPDIPIEIDLYNDHCREASTIHHFYEKLLRLKNDFETETGRSLAHERAEYLETFLATFLSEWAQADMEL